MSLVCFTLVLSRWLYQWVSHWLYQPLSRWLYQPGYHTGYISGYINLYHAGYISGYINLYHAGFYTSLSLYASNLLSTEVVCYPRKSITLCDWRDIDGARPSLSRFVPW